MKSELGNRINYVHDAFTKHDVGQQTSQELLAKVFQPVTTKLDDVITSNLIMPQRKRRPLKKGETPDYGINIDDEVEDMNHRKKNRSYQNHQHIKNLYKIPFWKGRRRFMLIPNISRMNHRQNMMM